MRRIVDLTLPIEEHWRYGIKILPGKTHANGDPWQNVSYNLESHWFTHIDFPLHFDPNGKTSYDYPSGLGNHRLPGSGFLRLRRQYGNYWRDAGKGE